MRRIALTLAVTGAVLGTAAASLPAVAGTAGVQHAASRATGASPLRTRTPTLTAGQVKALRRAKRLTAELRRRGAVTGVVLRPGGAPAAGVCVQARGLLTTRTAFSKPDGRFIISGLPLGSYRIEYRGCSPIAKFTAEWYGGLTRASAAKVRVTGGAPVSLAPVTLSMISPRFEAQAAKPASRPSKAAFGGLLGQIGALVGLPASSAGAPPQPTSPSYSRVVGRVANRSGHPLAGVCVFAAQSFGRHFYLDAGSVTGMSGGYRLKLSPGSYLIDFLPACGQRGNYAPQLWKHAGSLAKATLVKVRRRHTVRNIDAKLGVGARITGKITVAGGHHPPLGGVCVQATGTAGQRLFAGLATTRRDGTFTLHSLATGRYRVSIAGDCGRPSPYLPVTLSRLIRVTNGKTTSGLRVALTVGGSITGRVKDTQGNPLAGICADAGTGRSLYEGTTRPNGTYRVEGLPAGAYRMSFSPGCGNNGPYRPLTLPGKVTVALGKTTAGVDAVLQTDGSIRGVVTNADGAPVAGVCVVVFGPGFGFAVTNASGAYRARDLPAGFYQVQFIPGGAFSDCGSTGNYLPVNDSASVSSGTATTLNEVLPTGGIISGVVRDSHGKPLSGICVFSNGRSPFANQIVTKTDGSYRLPQLFTGSYFVGFSGGCGNKESVAPQAYRGDPTFLAPASIPVTQGLVTGGIGARMRPGGVLTGRITDKSGRPLSNICLAIFAITGAGGGQFADFKISRHGRYSSANLPPGQYTVVFSGLFVRHRGCGSSPYADQQFKGVGLGAAGDQVVVPGGRVTRGVDATLVPSGKLSGVVRSSAGNTVSGVCVTAIDPATKAEGVAFSGRRGKYLLTDLPAGRYLVEFSDCGAESFFFGGGPGYANQWYRNSPTRSGATAVVVRAGDTTPNINAALTPGGTVTGQVTFRPTGRPVSSVCVFAFTPNFAAFGFGFTGRRGHYSISGLSTGHYLLAFEPCSYESALAAQFRAGHVSVVAGRTIHGVSEALRVGGSVSGAVSYTADSKTRPAPGTCVEVLPLGHTGVGFLTLSGHGGSYLATNLAPGLYQVIFGDPGCSSDSPTLSGSVSAVTRVVIRKTTSGVDATLRLTGGISGVVRGPGGGISGICVRAMPVHLATPGLTRATAVGISRAGGRYSIHGLQPGAYRVEFAPGCGATGYATRWYREARTRKNAARVKVAAAAVTGGIGARLPRR